MRLPRLDIVGKATSMIGDHRLFVASERQATVMRMPVESLAANRGLCRVLWAAPWAGLPLGELLEVAKVPNAVLAWEPSSVV